jgi:predicted PolB exonuclease-like 3'-5' exonuclease
LGYQTVGAGRLKPTLFHFRFNIASALASCLNGAVRVYIDATISYFHQGRCRVESVRRIAIHYEGSGMPDHVIVWDLETVPDLRGFAAANDFEGKSDEKVRQAMGEKFPKHLYHSIVCIGALAAHRDAEYWAVDSLSAPHVSERTERELISLFVDRVAELNPQLITFNGNSFDLPVLRYRAMAHSVSAVGLSARPYFNRYSDDSMDLCDVLSSFSPQARATLHEISRVMGLPGKPESIDGSEVEKYFREGRIQEIADYCEADIVNTYRVWLRHELFRGKLKMSQFENSEQKLREYIKACAATKPHLVAMLGR